MPCRRSPPLKAINHTPKQPLLRHRPRYVYVLLILLALYLWYISSLHLLPHRTPTHAPSLIYKNVDWSRYAYVLYATDTATLCNALMVFSSLSTLGSRADRVLLYPAGWNLEVESSTDRDSQLLVKARDSIKAKLVPVDDALGIEFRAWGLEQYDRVLALEGDVTVLREMDGLFLAPRARVAMVRRYEMLSDLRELAGNFVLLEPEEVSFQRLMVEARKGDGRTQILNRLYRSSAMVLSHRELGLLTQEFRAKDHSIFLGSDLEEWDPERVMQEASLVQFVDDPLPKPWIMWPHELVGEVMPKCRVGVVGDDDCRDKKIWTDLYDDFRKRRKEVCALLSAPAPEWPPRNVTDKAD